jgi:hypothetical protein
MPCPYERDSKQIGHGNILGIAPQKLLVDRDSIGEPPLSQEHHRRGQFRVLLRLVHDFRLYFRTA